MDMEQEFRHGTAFIDRISRVPLYGVYQILTNKNI
jgi:hypothetical protein